jgi:hypothetical protein
MKAGTPQHFKTHRLKRMLKIPVYQAVGILEALWQFVSANAWEGNLGKIPDEDIIAALEYEGDGKCLIAALLACHFLDIDDNHRYRVHDWYDHAPEYVRKRIDRKYNKRPEGFVGQWPPLSAVVGQCQPIGALTKPCQDQAKPEPEPSQTKPEDSFPEPPSAASVPPEPPVLEFPIDGGRAKTWGLKRSKVDEWKEHFPSLDVLAECRKALVWCIDNPTKRKTASGMTPFLSRWLIRAQNSQGGSSSRAPPSTQSPADVAMAWAERKQAGKKNG